MFYKPQKCLGVGINFTSETADDIVHNIDNIDFIEVNTERFFVEGNNRQLDKIISSVPIVLHGLTLSIGTDQMISQLYLDNLSSTLDQIDCEWLSEHISVASVDGMDTRALIPVSFSEENIEKIVNKTKNLMTYTTKTFLLENITYYYLMPNSQVSEAYFIKKIIEQADCGLLLDINNLYVNSINHHYDPYKFLEQLPLERVVEVHLAGCDYRHNMLIDTHASRTKKEVLELFNYVCKKSEPNGVVIERDSGLDNFSELLEEIMIVKNILRKNNIICTT